MVFYHGKEVFRQRYISGLIISKEIIKDEKLG